MPDLPLPLSPRHLKVQLLFVKAVWKFGDGGG